MIPSGRVRRRRTERRTTDALPLELALDILELLSSRPGGLTIFEIAACLQCPVSEVVSTVAVMQRRQWLRTDARRGGLTLGDRMMGLSGKH